MAIVQLRYKNIFLLLGIVTSVYIVITFKNVIFHDGILELIYGEDTAGPCTKYLHYIDGAAAKRWPLIGILGPPDSGVRWMRYLIEQLTGIYTGSTVMENTHLFTAEGKTRRVAAVLTHDVSSLPYMKAGILIYRGMEETIRSQYAAKHGPGALLEAPMEAYYGKEWEIFAMKQGKKWAEMYRDYVKSGKPLIVVSYDELRDPDQVQRQMLHISHFLRVPIKQSVLTCLVEKSSDMDLYPEYKPRPLRYGFRPFDLLPLAKQEILERFENYTERLIVRTREGFVPRIHA